MFKSQRLDGLELLRIIRAPVPNWQLVEKKEDIDRIKIDTQKYGWTIRTCRKDGKREAGLFNVNNIENKEIAYTFEIIFKNNDKNLFYIIYPSWKFIFSCNIILIDNNFTIEGMYGSQKEISIGKLLPDFGVHIPFGYRSRMVRYIGELNDDVYNWLGKIIWWCKRIPIDTFYAEVALKSTYTLVFYDLFDLKVKRF